MAEPRTRPELRGRARGGGRRWSGTSRRRFLGFALAAPAWVTAASPLGSPSRPAASIPSPPEPSDLFDLGDPQDLAAAPTSTTSRSRSTRTATRLRAAARRGGPGHHHVDGDDHRRGDRPAGGQGARDARRRPPGTGVQPAHRRLERDPLAVAGARGSGRRAPTLVEARRRSGSRRADRGCAPKTASSTPRTAAAPATARPPRGGRAVDDGHEVKLKDPADFRLIGKPHNRVDALAAVTGTKTYTLDLQGAGRAADDDVPAADDQRDGQAAAQPERDQAATGCHGRRRHLDRRRDTRPGRSGSASTPSAPARWTGTPAPTDGRLDATC